MARRLFRSTQNKMLAGVCGGLAEYFETDPSLIRIAAVAFLFAGGVGFIAYIVAWIILPKADSMSQLSQSKVNNSSAGTTNQTQSGGSFWSTYFPGLLLITLGSIFLLRELFYWIDWNDIWPVILILVGAGIILAGPWRSARKDRLAESLSSPSSVSHSGNAHSESQSPGDTH